MELYPLGNLLVFSKILVWTTGNIYKDRVRGFIEVQFKNNLVSSRIEMMKKLRVTIHDAFTWLTFKSTLK